MKKIFLIIVFLLLTFQTFAASRSFHALKTEVSETSFEASLITGYHFNKDAPNEIASSSKKIKPTQIENQKILFKLDQKNTKTAVAKLYVCDDALTYCETHKISIGKSNVEKTAAAKKDAFVIGLSKSKAKKKLLILDFSARWCPGCVRYEEEIFNTAEFKKKSSRFILQKVDVDLFENSAVSKKFNVVGIPSLVVVNSEGQEINRLVDFQSTDVLYPFLDEIKKDPTPVAVLEKSLESTDPIKLRNVGKRFLAAGLPEKALQAFSKVTPPPFELASAKIEVAKQKYENAKSETNKQELINILKSEIDKESQTTRSLGWRAELISLIKESKAEVEKLTKEAQTLSDALLADEKKLSEAIQTDSPGEMTGYEKILVLSYLTDVYDTAEMPLDEVNKKAAEVAQEYQISPKNSGPARRYLILLNTAKLYEKAQNYALEILKAEPNNFDAQRRLVRIYLSLEKPQEALDLAKKILPKAEGRNHVWVTESMVKAYIALKKNAEAKKLITTTLASSEIEQSNVKSVKASLQEILKTLQ